LLFSACFWFFRKSVPKEVEMPRNLLMIFFWRKETLEDTGGCQKPHKEATRQQGVAPGGRALMPCAPLVAPFDLIPLLQILKYSETNREPDEKTLPPPQASVLPRSHLEAFSGT
jgi:hypothetical protein